MNNQWAQWAVELQSLAQTGLAYGKDAFDKERYIRIREISAEMMSALSNLPVTTVQNLFCNESGYQTPKIDTRAAIFQDDKILLVREKNGQWCLPGGWCDVDQSIASNIVKECEEETGLTVEPEKLIAIQDWRKHNAQNYAFGVIKVFVLCQARGGAFEENIETIETNYFAQNELPSNLATQKTTSEQIAVCFEAYSAENWTTQFD